MKKYHVSLFPMALIFSCFLIAQIVYDYKCVFPKQDVVMIICTGILGIVWLFFTLAGGIGMTFSEEGLTRQWFGIPLWTVRWEKIAKVSITPGFNRDIKKNILFCTTENEDGKLHSRFTPLLFDGLSKKQMQKVLKFVHAYYGSVDDSWYPEYLEKE